MKKIIAFAFAICFTFSSKAQDSNSLLLKDAKLYSVLWQQTAAEYRALCYQAFNLAKLRLNEVPSLKFKKEKLAIITDLDETILDNSYSEARHIKDAGSKPIDYWKEWVAQSAATGVPGAVDFLQYAKRKGVTIFYISNRNVKDLGATLINLKKLLLPDADSAHCLFLSTTSSKEERRQIVMKKYKVLMLLGDNLNDFTSAFERKSISDRFDEVDKGKEEWGKRFIVLPNATYGEWENALFNYDNHLTTSQKLNALIKQLKDYK